MVSRYYVGFLVAFFGVVGISFANDSKLPPIKVPDQIRLREAIRFVHETFDSVWSTGPRPNFELLFIDDSIEYLINHEGQPPGFSSAQFVPVLERPVMARHRTFPVGFLATFPAFSGQSTILVGRPENTLPKTSSAWIATLAHERLHQIQDACPGMGEKLVALDLAGKDATGMWMLNYPFPYDSVPVVVAYDAYMASLVAALNKRGTTEFPDLLRAVVAARDRLRSELSEKDYRYMAFQLWKEGIARYSEFMIPQLAARWYAPSKEFSELPDFQTFETTANRIYENSLAELRPNALRDTQRIIFYATGLAEGLLLDECAPGWRDRYLTGPLDTRQYFDER